MPAADPRIARIATLAGIAAGFTDVHGNHVAAKEESRRAILADFGLTTETDDAVAESLARVEAMRNALVPALLPVLSDTSLTVTLRSPVRGVARWRLACEDGSTAEGAAEAGQALALPALPAGYHRLHVQADGREADATLIAGPARCWVPESFARGERLWGMAAQIYGLRSRRNLGIGDFSDVADAAEGAGRLGAAFLGLSPVHALFGTDRSKISPYSPSSRLFLETLHVDLTAIEGFAGSTAARLLEGGDIRARLDELRSAALVDHAAVWAIKRPLLDALWAERGGHEDGAFAAFRSEGGDALEAHAAFEALSERFWREGLWWVGEWPEEYRRCGTEAVRRVHREEQERISFHAWLQFQADRQLAAASDAARASGMPVGLYRDLAVGADRGGSEVWSAPDRFGPTLSIGAPPDLLGPLGQNWGLPPFDPLALERQGLAAFRALVVANMRQAGAIRIDHAFQLQRLFLIPQGCSAAEGAYVEYPFEAMLAVLRLESHRARCLVIGEDLGTGPEGFSEAIMQSGIMSYRVLQFERDRATGYKRPGDYPRDALAVISTHDLPTFVGWWRGLDTGLRRSLDLYDDAQAAEEKQERVIERRQLAEALHAEGLLPSAQPPDTAPLEPVVRYLGRSASLLTALQYEDVLGESDQANMPGVTDGHPNWRRRLSQDLDAINAADGPLAQLAAALALEGRHQAEDDRP